MGHGLPTLLLYGLLAGLSPLAFAATITVMQAGRLSALAFGAGFVLGQAFTCSLFVIVGVAATGTTRKSHSGLHATLDLLLAVAVIGLAARVWRRGPVEREGSGARTRAFLDRLAGLRLRTTSLAGFALGIGGPKRLLLSALAATVITTAGVGDSGEAVLVVWYVAIATALVWAPTACFVLVGERTIGLMKRAQAGLARRQPELIVYALLVLAAALVIDAITAL